MNYPLRIKHYALSIVLLFAGQAVAQQAYDRKTIEVSAERLSSSPEGPFEASWESVARNYKTPEWFKNAKFGIFIHWGAYSVAAAGSEWYPRHMYGGMAKHHKETWGSQSEFGYKDFLPLFKAEKFDASEWAQLFAEAGARYVIPTAEHHDGFAMYDSELTRWDAKEMGPQRDVIGELAEAVRSEGMKFGVSNHRVEHWDFMYPKMPVEQTDLFNPDYADFYGPPQVPTEQSAMGPKALHTEKNGATEAVIDEAALEGRHPQSDAFMNEWQARVMEIIDKYQPDAMFFDNGINYRSMDPWKLRVAKYYYNSAWQWGKEVSIQSKGKAYLYGTVQDCERQNRAPKEKTDYYWQVDDPIGHKFGYVEGLRLQTSEGVIRKLVENISKNGNLCLNVSPKGDGTIPEDQQKVLREIGKWLKRYGEAVYDTRACDVWGEGPRMTGFENETNLRFTQKGSNTLYAFAVKWNGKPFYIHHLKDKEVDKVVCLATGKEVDFEQTDKGLFVKASLAVTEPAVAFRIVFKLNGKRVLFIGDSITDGGWGRSGGSMTASDKRNHTDLNHLYGHSYMMLCASELESRQPDSGWKFFNRGISGNTVYQLASRWQKDAMALDADVVMMLVGINEVYDVAREKKENPKAKFDYSLWEKTYCSLLDSLRKNNPNVRIMLGTPFLAKEGKRGEAKEYNDCKQMVEKLCRIVRRIAKRYDATLVPFDTMFAELVACQPRPGYWIWDGVHPTAAGHRRMADLWIRVFDNVRH